MPFFSLFRSRSVLLCAFSHTTNETNKQTRQTERNNNNNPLQVWFCSDGLGFGLGVERLVLGLIHLPSCSRCWFAASPHPGSHCPTDAPFQNETAAALSWRKSMATWKRCRTSGTIATSLGTHPTSSSSLASRGPFVNSFCFCLFHFLAHSRSLPLTLPLFSQQTEELLCQLSCPGAYLVRESSDGTHTVLSVRYCSFVSLEKLVPPTRRMFSLSLCSLYSLSVCVCVLSLFLAPKQQQQQQQLTLCTLFLFLLAALRDNGGMVVHYRISRNEDGTVQFTVGPRCKCPLRLTRSFIAQHPTLRTPPTFDTFTSTPKHTHTHPVLLSLSLCLWCNAQGPRGPCVQRPRGAH